MEKNILSLKLKRYREEKGITQQELAEILDVSDKSISKGEEEIQMDGLKLP